MSPILVIPPDCALSQAEFGISYGGLVETRRGGAEDVFLNQPDRWTAVFLVAASMDTMASWRLLLRRLNGPAGLIYVHDVTNPAPRGGARTAEAFAAFQPTAAPLVWRTASGGAVTWTDAASDTIVWSTLPAIPADTDLAVAASALAGATEVSIKGLWPSNVAAIEAGEYVQIEHWLYLATDDAQSDANGVATVRITPPLWRFAAGNTPVKLEQAASLMRLDVTDVSWSRFAQDRRTPFRLVFREVLPTEGVP